MADINVSTLSSSLRAGAPGGKQPPFIFDMSPAVAARGKIRLAIKRGEKIPEGWGLDKEGRLVFCAHGDRAIVRREKDGSRTILADRWDGKRFEPITDWYSAVGIFFRLSASCVIVSTDLLPLGGLAFFAMLSFLTGPAGPWPTESSD